MFLTIYNDGSCQEHYEDGDLVTVIKAAPGGLGADLGDWGRVRLRDNKDRERGYSSSISHVRVITAGVSTPKNSFQQQIPSIPVWHLKGGRPLPAKTDKR